MLLLTSCFWNKDKNKVSEEEKAKISQSSKSKKPNNNQLLINSKLTQADLDRLKKLLSSDTNYYLFSNDDYKKDTEILQKELEHLKNDKIYKTNPDTKKPYTLEEYKTSRLELVKYVNPDSLKESQEKLIDTELWLKQYAIKTDSYTSFMTYTDSKGQTKSYSVNEAKKRLSDANNDKKEEIKVLQAEKEALNSGKFESFVLVPQDEIKWKIETVNLKLGLYNKVIKEWESIKKIVSLYKNTSSNQTSKYNPEEVKYIFNNVLGVKVEVKNFKYINQAEAKNILTTFEKGKLVKVTKKLSSGMNISSDTLYAKVTNDKGISYYIDEKVYLNLKHSMKVWWTNFIIYENDYDKWYDAKIYAFLTWYDPSKSYYKSLGEYILSKGNIDVHKAIFTLTAKEVNENWFTYNTYIWAPVVDIEKNWLLSNLLFIIIWKTKSPNPSISAEQLREFLINLF